MTSNLANGGPVATISRTVGQRLTGADGDALITDVEAALNDPDHRSRQYADPIAIASLIVAIASLAWAIYTDLKKTTPQPPAQTLARAIRLKLHHTYVIDETTTKIIEITVEETTKYESN